MSEEFCRKQFKNIVNSLDINKWDKKVLKDLYMERCKVIDKAIEYIKAVGVLPRQIDSFVLLEILGDKENE